MCDISCVSQLCMHGCSVRVFIQCVVLVGGTGNSDPSNQGVLL